MDFSTFKDLQKLDKKLIESISLGIDSIQPIVDYDITSQEVLIINMVIVNNFARFANAYTKVKPIDMFYNYLKLDQNLLSRQRKIYRKLNYDKEKFIRAASLIY